MSQDCCGTGGPEHNGQPSGFFRSPELWDMLRLIGAGIAVVLMWLGVVGSQERLDLFGVAVVAFCGYPIFKAAISSLLKKRMTMELSMTIALVAALAVGEVFTALVIIFFVLGAEEIEHLTIKRGRNSIRSLLDLMPRTAVRRVDGVDTEVDLADLRQGDILIIKPGAAVVADGVVLSGSSFVDEATITGESFPKEKLPGSRVYAGTINQAGALEIRAERLGHDTAFGKIVDAVEEAERSRAQIQKTADRLAGYLVYFAIGSAALTFLVTQNVEQTISVIIVAGACGIAAGTPLAIMGSIGAAAKQGTIVKGGLYLEKLADVDTVVFDKTGTLTHGTPEVVDIMPEEGVTPEMVLGVAAAAETLSEHPLGRAINGKAREMSLTPPVSDRFRYIPGRGILCYLGEQPVLVGNRALLIEHGVAGVGQKERLEHVSQVFVALDGRLLGIIAVADKVRPESAQAIAELHAMGIRTILLSGDAEPIVAAVGKQLGLQEYAGELRPEDKQSRVRTLQQGGLTVAMVGDGVNDAPALTEAAVGVAIGSGTDVALESADIVLIGNDLVKFVETVRIARRCRKVIYFNFAGTIAFDSVGMVLALLGALNPLLAAFIHVGSEVFFLLNSVRLFPMFGKFRPNKKAK